MSDLKYRLTIHPDMDNSTESFTTQEYATKEELTAGIDTCAKVLLFMQDVMRIMPDCSNMFISEELVSGEWEEILDMD